MGIWDKIKQHLNPDDPLPASTGSITAPDGKKKLINSLDETDGKDITDDPNRDTIIGIGIDAVDIDPELAAILEKLNRTQGKN